MFGVTRGGGSPSFQGSTNSGTHPFHPRRSNRMRLTRILFTVSALVLTLIPAQAAHAAAVDTVAVDFSTANGTPVHRGSGTIYGMTEDGSLPQDHFYTDIGW